MYANHFKVNPDPLTIAFIVFVFVAVVFSYVAFKGKKANVETMAISLEDRMKLELNNALAPSDELLHYIDVQWRHWLNLTSYHYYLGLSKNNLVLVKFKKNAYLYPDKGNSVTRVNHPYRKIENLSFTEDSLSESAGKFHINHKVKRIRFTVENKKFDLRVKYGGQFQNNQQLGDIETMLRNKTQL